MTFVFLLMAYLAIGTAYNRYALHLSGFDQLPRFSLESARYHAGEAGYYAEEAIVWITGVLQKLFGREDNDYMGGVGGTNPVSHQAQVRTGTGGDIGARGLGRPPRVDTNPVSHHMNSQMAPSGHHNDNAADSARLDSNDTRKETKPVPKNVPEEQFHLLDGADDVDDAEGEPERDGHESESVAAIRGRGTDMAAEGAVRL